jgi:starch synthase
MPKYLSIARQNLAMAQMTAITVQTHRGRHGAALWQTETVGVPTDFVENEVFFNHEDFYGPGDWNYPDNSERFVFFCKAVLACCNVINFLPDAIFQNLNLLERNQSEHTMIPQILKKRWSLWGCMCFPVSC